ncbi:protocatechuate 4,5-dioxygenase subunit alpha [Novosphingobium sp. KN65.2]|uniref:protocatechuate 4,5-dioxygenase subunit alpha n=1 Tax=Novosphingobium sp. KN65.2 TaxID=1478134 RepID=UPI0005E9D41B|nr:protocatechuate 4,5-dioxygenase subunit alpha [Novosphingobium sp. KN65.2]CDO35495.1 Protocatechuate 4,5-dioxygenase (4,5-PCD), alpha chain [Novosphingobium sp. KN65.2]
MDGTRNLAGNGESDRTPIPGTPLFDGEAAGRGYQLNAMCYSFNDARNRAAFLEDEAGYCDRFGLTPQQRDAVAARNVLAMIEAGGNIYYLAKLAGIFGFNVQDVGAQQTGKTVEAFKQMLLDRALPVQEGE